MKNISHFNTYRIENDTVYFIASYKNKIFKECKIDLEELNKVKSYGHWFLRYNKHNDEYYVVHSFRYTDEFGKRKGTTLHLHRIIMNVVDPKQIVDHINAKDTLDNRKSNLRITEYCKNSTNRKGANKNNNTGFRNVSWIERDNVYWVQMMKNGEKYKWEFPQNEFQKACEFAENKRIELFGEYAGNS